MHTQPSKPSNVLEFYFVSRVLANVLEVLVFLNVLEIDSKKTDPPPRIFALYIVIINLLNCVNDISFGLPVGFGSAPPAFNYKIRSPCWCYFSIIATNLGIFNAQA